VPGGDLALLLESKLTGEDACIVVAEQDGVLIGYVSGSVRTAFYAAGATAWVDEILVVPEARGHGIGSRLMSAFEAWAADHDSGSVALATRGAAKFYEGLGYESRAAYLKKYLTPSSISSAESKS
jgi:GNAT superfamily N-acetyltransferase